MNDRKHTLVANVVAAAVIAGITAGLTIWVINEGADRAAPTSTPLSIDADGSSVVVNEDGQPIAVDSPSESPAPVEPTVPDWVPDGMAPCATEDSMNCYWDAATHGNGEGCSFVAQDGFIIYTEGDCASYVAEPEPVVEPEPSKPDHPVAEDWETLPDEDPEYTLETWPFTHGETLVCGHGAKPAIDYRSDVGYWAYCEPALVP